MNRSSTPLANFVLALVGLAENLVSLLLLGHFEFDWRWQASKSQFIRDLELDSMKGWDG